MHTGVGSHLAEGAVGFLAEQCVVSQIGHVVIQVLVQVVVGAGDAHAVELDVGAVARSNVLPLGGISRGHKLAVGHHPLAKIVGHHEVGESVAVGVGGHQGKGTAVVARPKLAFRFGEAPVAVVEVEVVLKADVRKAHHVAVFVVEQVRVFQVIAYVDVQVGVVVGVDEGAGHAQFEVAEPGAEPDFHKAANAVVTVEQIALEHHAKSGVPGGDQKVGEAVVVEVAGHYSGGVSNAGLKQVDLVRNV